MTPWNYACRYLAIDVPGVATGPVKIGRYHRGAPTKAKDELLGTVRDHFGHHKADRLYRLATTINGQPFAVQSYDEIKLNLQNPFIGKGSPEECQLVLQLAVALKLVRPQSLQTWADLNLGLDCNGFVGNYLVHDLLAKPWRNTASAKEVGPCSACRRRMRSSAASVATTRGGRVSAMAAPVGRQGHRGADRSAPLAHAMSACGISGIRRSRACSRCS